MKVSSQDCFGGKAPEKTGRKAKVTGGPCQATLENSVPEQLCCTQPPLLFLRLWEGSWLKATGTFQTSTGSELVVQAELTALGWGHKQPGVRKTQTRVGYQEAAQSHK